MAKTVQTGKQQYFFLFTAEAVSLHKIHLQK